jgi:serine/threonine-protein kinase
MTCRVCGHVNEVYTSRCIGCGNSLNESIHPEKIASEKEVSVKNLSPFETALKDIKNAWMAAIFSGVMTLIITAMAISGNRYLSFSAFNLLDVFLLFGLACGIYKKSRTCAVIIFVYFLLSKYDLYKEAGSVQGLPVALALAYFYFRGILGTFNYHKLINQK